MIKKIVISLIISFLFGSVAFAQTLTIAAAADLRYALDELKTEFSKTNPDIKIDVIYGSSGKLYQQIVSSAPFDLFFSADIMYPKKLDSLKLTTNEPKLYAIGFLVLWSSTFEMSDGINMLKNSTIKKIAIASPNHAPYGKRAVECLKFYKLYNQVKSKLVEGENISQAAQFVLSGNAEVGIIALSLALSPEMQKNGTYVLIDQKSYSTLEQAYVVLKNSDSKAEAAKFTTFIETEQARKIFRKYGFKLPNEK